METQRRLSVVRLLVVLAVVAASCFLVWSQVSAAYTRLTASPIVTWFAPYVDVTLSPALQFEDPVVSPLPYDALGFVVADPHNACTPTWGTYYSLEGASRELDLDRRITRLRSRGGDVIVSFGGEANQELATVCTNPAALLEAYRSVIDRYSLRTVDFDIEGAAQSDAAANARRAVAVRDLQRRAAHFNRQLIVWLTLPVTPQGLTQDGLNVVRSMMNAGVRLGGVNALIMDYGGTLPSGESISTANSSALHGVFKQLKSLYRQAGVRLQDRQIWRRIGATPMIGQNDTDGQVFTLSDADALVSLARNVGLGRVSMWSANRDSQCGVNVDTSRVSNVCSGIGQDALAFTWDLGRLNGVLPAHVPGPDLQVLGRVPSRDNPLTSPYQIWSSSQMYQEGDKVAWHGSVYEAKWFTRGDVPDQAVAHLWDTPWSDLGPVLPSDEGVPATAGASAVRHWSRTQVYITGQRVIDHGYVFQARWWTQGEEPVVYPLQPADATWTVVRKLPPPPTPVPVAYPTATPTLTPTPTSTRTAHPAR